MTHTVRCHQCDTVLYEGQALKPPYEIVTQYNGRCPHCGRKLSTIPVRFAVTPIAQTSP
jgi:phage FluMu protein Com